MAPVGPRAAKDEFMRALNLNPSDSHHEGYYRQMRDEAITMYNKLQNDRSCLLDQQRHDQSIQPPFFWHHITKERQQRAIIDTWQNARGGSPARQLFDRGVTNGEHGPNWVTHWLLYSVFRSRDVRNNRNRRTGENGCNATSTGVNGRHTETKMYDAARNSYRPK